MENPSKGRKLLTSLKFPYGIIPFRCKVLDDLIYKCKSENEIVRRYCSLNMAEIMDLDFHYRNQIDYLKKLDSDNQYIKIASFVDEHVLSVQLFFLFNHPSLDVFRKIIDQLFYAFGIANDLPEEIPDNFSYHQIPIHPSVVKYFGLKFVKDEAIWPVGPHKVSYDDYVRLYIKGYMDEIGKRI
jgi:hypothetical protein